MAWFYLIIAGCFEIAWALGIKLSHGFTRPLIASMTLIAMILSLYFLVLAVRDLPIGTAYAIWTGMGAAGVALLGIAFLGEPLSIIRLLFIGLILTGIVGLKLSTT